MAAKKSSKPKTAARKPAKKGGSARAAATGGTARAQAAPKGGSTGIVHSDVRRDALAWQLSKLAR